VHTIAPTDWVLCDIRIQGIHAGFGHGTMTLFSDSGVLMASASQSVIVRIHGGAAEPSAKPAASSEGRA
jgi:acyl-CoA thioesterase